MKPKKQPVFNYFLCESEGTLAVIEKKVGKKPTDRWSVIKPFGSNRPAAESALKAARFKQSVDAQLTINIKS